MSRLVLVVSCLMIGALGCGKDAPAEPPPPPKEARSQVRPAVVTAYDAVRERLAEDDLAGTKRTAAELSKLEALAAGIGSGAESVAKAADIEAAREAFGDLSKAYITMLSAKPEVAKGLFAFRCPMAKGYQKWVQLEEKMANPYMGQRMLECGSKVPMEP